MSKGESSPNTPRPYWGPFPGESSELYERLGVPRIYKTIKPHFPKSLIGDFDMRRGRPTNSTPEDGSETLSKQEKLERYVEWTKKNEKIHLGGFAVFSAFSAYFFQQHDPEGILLGVTYSVANVALNLYPIALQRHNRLKAYNVLARLRR